MSVQAIAWVLENSNAELGARLTLLSIANHARADGTGAWPSLAALAKEAHLSERQVRYCLRKLERSGELQTQISAGPRGTNTYSLPLMRGGNICRGRGAIYDTKGGNPLPGGGGNPVPPNRPLNRHKREPSLKSSEENLDDFKKLVLTKCQDDPSGTIASALEIIVQRAKRSGISINSAAYLETALNRFNFEAGPDREELMLWLKFRQQ